ncbi:MAG: AMP-binding protein [Acidimicrobiales bacterium]
MQLNISSRATAAVHQNVTVCRLVGARSRVLGVVPPAESVDSLLTGGSQAPTIVNTYPSYLAALLWEARRRRLGPDDFNLSRIVCGGEVLSPALTAAALETFGPDRVTDSFGMTEVLPVSGRVCDQFHMHHDLNMGFIEVIDLDTGAEAAPGELGTVVITPYFPYRECMPVFRYDTRDIVRRLPDEPLTCELSGTPATSRILGKADHTLRVAGRILALRDLVEVVEAMPSQPWPARFSASVEDGRVRLTMSDSDLDAGAKRELQQRFRESGVEVDVPAGITDVTPEHLRPLRADLVETTFSGKRI